MEMHRFFRNSLKSAVTTRLTLQNKIDQALESTERTSTMVENLRSRLRPYFYLRREISLGYLGLLRFCLNDTPFEWSPKTERKKKSSAEIKRSVLCIWVKDAVLPALQDSRLT